MILALALCAGCPTNRVSDGDARKSQTRLDLAKDFFSRNELEAAVAEANKAIGYDPRNDEAHNLLGLIDLTRAVSIQKDVEVAGCLTGLDAEALRGEIDRHLELAGGHFQRAAQISDEYGEAWSNVGTVALLQGEVDRGKAAFEKALAAPVRLDNPALTRAHLGWAYFQKNDMVSAFKELRQALQFQPGMCVATYRLGRVYFGREEWENAAEKFQEVTDQPTCRSQEAALYLMKARLEQGLLDDARAAQAACVALAPASCVAAQCRTASFDGGAR